MRASGWSATTRACRRAKVREADEERRCKPRSARASRTRRSVTERSRSRSARISRCPIQRTSWSAIGEAGYAGTDLGPPGYLGEGETLQQRLASQPARPRRRLRPRALQRARALGRGPRRPHGTRSRSSTPRKRPRRARSCATPAAPSGSPTPARGGRARARRHPLGDARGRRRARRRDRARGGLRARLPPPHVELRRGPAGDRALPRPTPTSTCCSTAATSPSPAATRSRACRTGATRVGVVHLKDTRMDVLTRSARSART